MNPQASRIYFDPPVTQGATFAARKGDQTKEYLAKIAKLVPVEIVGAYKAAMLFATQVQPDSVRICFYWGLFILGIIGTLWYVGWQIGTSFVKQKHLLVYSAAFVVWAYAITGNSLLPFKYGYQEPVAAILLIVASVIFGKIKLPAKEKKKSS